MTKEYSIGNGRNVSVVYNEQEVAQVSKEMIEQCFIPLLRKSEKYKWHDLRKAPNDLPKNENPIIAKIKFYGKGSGMYKPNCYTSGVYEQYFKRWNLEQDHKWHDEYNPFVKYEVLKWKYIDDEESEV